MKKLFKSFLILSAIAMAIPCFAQTPNTLTKKEKKAGWELLFNGKDFSGWRQCNGTAMPKMVRKLLSILYGAKSGMIW